MREARHDSVRILRRLFEQRFHKLLKLGIKLVEIIAHPKAEIRGDLVIARAPRMEPSRRFADKVF